MRINTRIVSAVVLVLAAAGCAGSSDEPASICDQAPTTASTAPDAVGLIASHLFTRALAIVAAPKNGAATEIEWMPVYAISNLTDKAICVHDVTLDFPPVTDKNGTVGALKHTGPSRRVELYLDEAALKSHTPSSTQPLPFILEPRATIMALFYQYYAFTLDGREVSMKVDESLAEYLGPYFGLERLGTGGKYQCDDLFPGLKPVVQSNLGRSTHDVVHLLMPAGCVKAIPPR